MEGASVLFQLPRVARIAYNLMVLREWNMQDIRVSTHEIGVRVRMKYV
ncbi:hypothetical protein [Paenibacillus sp. JJ-223]|nr:hypothetical protein [Paenibacillus sp. JJ-223]CAH1221863.1 hypothetical protein PAECIP111890_05307 [Paenibacillus sp. JJ-223]